MELKLFNGIFDVTPENKNNKTPREVFVEECKSVCETPFDLYRKLSVNGFKYKLSLKLLKDVFGEYRANRVNNGISRDVSALVYAVIAYHVDMRNVDKTVNGARRAAIRDGIKSVLFAFGIPTEDIKDISNAKIAELAYRLTEFKTAKGKRILDTASTYKALQVILDMFVSSDNLGDAGMRAYKKMNKALDKSFEKGNERTLNKLPEQTEEQTEQTEELPEQTEEQTEQTEEQTEQA